MPSTPSKPTYPPRLASALANNGLQALRSQKRKASQQINPRPSKIPTPSPAHPYILAQTQRYNTAAKTASSLFKAGYSKAVAMKVFDQVYQTGSYDRVLTGAKEEKPFFDLSDRRNRYVRQDIVDQVWGWEMKWDGKRVVDGEISPKGKGFWEKE